MTTEHQQVHYSINNAAPDDAMTDEAVVTTSEEDHGGAAAAAAAAVVVVSIDWSSPIIANNHGGRLYDRDDAVLQLTGAYERCLQQADHNDNPGSPNHHPRRGELVLITGPSGAGKTALAMSLKDRVEETHGIFLTGKFDEVAASNHRSTTAKSYGPFMEAFFEYSLQIQQMGEEFHESVKQALEEHMSSDEIHVLLESFPAALTNILESSSSSSSAAAAAANTASATVSSHHHHRRQQQQQQQRESQSASRRIVLRGADAEARFVGIVCKFLQIISSQGYPIVLFLDDVQWSDSSSLALLKAILASSNQHALCRFMVICTCHEEEEEEEEYGDQTNDVLEHLLQEHKKVGGHDYLTVTDIKTANLSKAAVENLLLDVLSAASPVTTSHNDHKLMELAEIIHAKSHGNAFHVWQLLRALEDEKLLYQELEEDGGELQWDADEIASLGGGSAAGTISSSSSSSSSAVLHLLNKRIHRLPEKVRELLKVAACLGTVFSEKCLQAGVYFPTSQVVSAIALSEQEGIIVRNGTGGSGSGGDSNKTFRFIHDLFRYATYKMIPDEIKNAFHLNIGRRLWHWLAKEDRDEQLLLVADQISRGIGLINDNEERDELARVFLMAAHKSAMASSFAASAAYLKCGMELLGGHNKWKLRYELSLTLYNTAAEIEYYCGNFPRVDELVDEIMKGARNFDDTILAHFTKIYCLGSRDEMSRALAEGLDVLKCLGETFPPRRRIGVWRTSWELKRCKRLLRNVSEQDILHLPRLTDTKKLTAMRLMNILHTFAFFAADPCGALLAARVVRMTLRYGMNELSCAGFANLGLIFATLGDVDEAYRCSLLALRIFESYRAKEWQGRLVFATYAFVFPLKRPLRDSIHHLLEGHQAGLVAGDISLSILSAFIYCLLRLYAGDPIPSVLEGAKTYRKLSSQYSQHFVISHFDMLIQVCLNMMGKAEDPLFLIGDSINELEAFHAWENTNPVLLMALHIWKHFLAVYLNEFQVAAVLAVKTNKIHAKLVPMTLNTHVFLQAVASAALSQSSRSHKRQTVSLLAEVKGYAQHSPENYLHKVCLVEAELAASMGSPEEALTKYELAIEHAKQQGFIHEQALACERAGYTLRQCGRNDEARNLIAKASLLYSEWGAQVKVDQLAKLRW